MRVARVIRSAVTDVEQISNLYHQLCDVPAEVQELFHQVDSAHRRLLDVVALVVKHGFDDPLDECVKAFQQFRTRLMELELFIDPDQTLPRSGAGSDTQHHWLGLGSRGPQLVESCEKFRGFLDELEQDCDSLVFRIQRIGSNSSPETSDTEVERDGSPIEEKGVLPSKSPSISELLSSSDAMHLPGSLNYFAFLYPSSTQQTSPIASPLSRAVHNLPPASPLNKPNPPFLSTPPLLPGETLASPSYAASVTMRRRKRKKSLAEIRVQQLVEQQYGKQIAAGVKRKRQEQEATNLPIQTTVSPRHDSQEPSRPVRTLAPQSPPLSPRLDTCDNLDEPPTWSLDDLHDALPVQNRVDDRRRANQSARDSNPRESWSSGHAGSGMCKIWYTSNGVLQQVHVAQLEIHRKSMPSNHGATIVATTPSGAKLVDDLWMPSIKAIASPFIENPEATATMRQRDPAIQSVVHFVPDADERRPRYSFASHQDYLEFMQAIAGRRLCASIGVRSIKSNKTRGNACETGDDTLQVWEGADKGSRTVRFFRGKNADAVPQVVELDCNCLRAPEKEERGGKLVFLLRDVRDGGVTKDIKYLKIAFSGRQAEEEFLDAAGIALHVPPKSRMKSRFG